MSGIGPGLVHLVALPHHAVHADVAEDARAEEPKEEAPAEEEPENAHPAIHIECEARRKCAPLKHHFEKRQEKVQAGEGFKGEECIEELPALRCSSSPASPDLECHGLHSLTPARLSIPPRCTVLSSTRNGRARKVRPSSPEPAGVNGSDEPRGPQRRCPQRAQRTVVLHDADPAPLLLLLYAHTHVVPAPNLPTVRPMSASFARRPRTRSAFARTHVPNWLRARMSDALKRIVRTLDTQYVVLMYTVTSK
ncbi:hypothetical protein DFH09DRAFT_1332241 [Mycena vulgaris]|nr:hypothetical protein DFH09DRAFT_1332241 [Mycena vulgaris]